MGHELYVSLPTGWGPNPVPTFNWIFEFQPIASEIKKKKLLQKSRKQLTNKEGPHHIGKVLVWVIHLCYLLFLGPRKILTITFSFNCIQLYSLKIQKIKGIRLLLIN